jgi:hypothetical protein
MDLVKPATKHLTIALNAKTISNASNATQILLS